jgi:hypothetical protein
VRIVSARDGADRYRRRTASVMGTPKARLIQGTLRSMSRCNERTRGPVSAMEVENPTVFSELLRSATSPVEEPAAIRDMALAPSKRSAVSPIVQELEVVPWGPHVVLLFWVGGLWFDRVSTHTRTGPVPPSGRHTNTGRPGLWVGDYLTIFGRDRA